MYNPFSKGVFMKVYIIAGLAITVCLQATEIPEATQIIAQEVDRACACSKPKPKKDIAVFDDTTKGCSCGGKSVDTDDTTKACACSKPKPKRDAITQEVLITRICAAFLNNQQAARAGQVQYISPAAHAIPQDAKTIDGGELFIQGAASMLQIVQGGITAHNSGKLENGLPNIFNGINGLVTLVSRSQNPEKTLTDFINFMQSFDAQEYKRMLHIARSQALYEKV